jgi:hypothetical protein
MGYPVGYSLPEGEPMLTLPNVWPDGLNGEAWPTPNAMDSRGHGATDGDHHMHDIKRGYLRGVAVPHQAWPAGLGAPQHEWEPPRLTTIKENRANRLKADGNSIVPQIARLWLEAIQEDALALD